MVAVLLVVVSGVLLWLQQGSSEADPADAKARAATPAASPAAAAPRPVLAPRRPADPERVRIPSLGVDAPVVPVKAPDRTLVPPADPTRLGWWADGARPGSPRGSALITGHTVHTGGGALDDLEQLRRGDRVMVRAGHDVVGYRVQSVQVLQKGALAQQAGRLFSQKVPGRLVLITCEQWNGVEYLSNVVVTARPRP